MLKISQWCKQKAFEHTHKIILRFQGITVISGMAFFRYYGKSPREFKVWKGYETKQIRDWDGFYIIKKIYSSSGS